ncbi:hypothetical protein BN7874_085 [Phage NCTB]|nr:hypothetical protein BN7874_085 [Phage NCTB]
MSNRKPKTIEQLGGTFITNDLHPMLLTGLLSGNINHALEHILTNECDSSHATDCLVYATVEEIENLVSRGKIEEEWLCRIMDMKEEIHIEMQSEIAHLKDMVSGNGFAEMFARA